MRKNLIKVTIGPKGEISYTGHRRHLDYFTALARAQAACTPEKVAEWGRNFEAMANRPETVDPTNPHTIDVPEVLKRGHEAAIRVGRLMDNALTYDDAADALKLMADAHTAIDAHTQDVPVSIATDSAELQTLREKVAELEELYTQSIKSRIHLGESNVELEDKSAAHMAEGKRIEAVWEARQVKWETEKAKLVAEIEEQRVALNAIKARPEMDYLGLAQQFAIALDGPYGWSSMSHPKRQRIMEALEEVFSTFQPLAALNARPQLDAEALCKALYAELSKFGERDWQSLSLDQWAKAMRTALSKFAAPASPLAGYEEVKPEDVKVGDEVARISLGTATDLDINDLTSPVQIDGYWGTAQSAPIFYRKPTATDNA